MLTSRPRTDEGALTLLIIGYAGILALLVVVGVDVSKVFLAQRSLSSVADAAALSAVQAVDRPSLYAGTAGGCGELLPVDPSLAEQEVGRVMADAVDLRRSFARLDVPDTDVVGGTVSVSLSGSIAVPFGRVVGLLLPGHDPLVPVSAHATAEAPLRSPDGC